MIKRLESSESALIEALRMEDGKAFELVYEKYYRMAASFINNNSGDDHDIADVFQEMLFILVRKLQDKNFQLTARLGTFIYAVIRNLWLARLKKKAASEITLHEEMEDLPVLDENELEVKQEYEKKHELMAQVLETLKEDCRQIILASFYKKLSHQAIAEEMGYSDAFVRVKLHRCMEGFRKEVRQHPAFEAL